MRTPIVAYFSSLIVMMVLDGTWFSFSLSRVYKPGIGYLLADKPNLPAALIFYLMYAAGVVYLVTLPALAAGQLSQAATRGAILGLIAYGTYDLTSMAVVRGWPLNVTVIDMVWGMIITGIVATVGFLVTRKFG
jgi:uncharacterized membrane protein